MSNAILAFPNLIDLTVPGTTISGGAWESVLPLTNLQNPMLARVARSADLELSSTQALIDFGAPMLVTVMALVAHTISRNGLIRFRSSDSASGFDDPITDSGWMDVWPVIWPSGSLHYGHPSFWDGKLSAAEGASSNQSFIYTINGTIARYWLMEIDDEENADGCLDAARLFMSNGWQTTINFIKGNSLAWEPETHVETSRGGVRFFDHQNERRVARFTINNLLEDEGLTKPFEMQRSLGIHKQLFFIYNPADTHHLQRRSFLATMRQLSPLDFTWHEHTSAAFELEEVL